MKQIILATLLLFAATSARAVGPVLKATVTGTDADLNDVLVAIPMGGARVGNARMLGVTNDAGELLASQYFHAGRLGGDGKPELLVLVPKLRAKAEVTLAVTEHIPPPGAMPLPRFLWSKDKANPETVQLREIRKDQRLVAQFTRFVFDAKASANPLTNPTIKPYHHVFDATGKQRLTNGPDGKFPHHRGIYFGFNQITYSGKKADVWHCRNGESQRADARQGVDSGNLAGVHDLKIAWHGQDGGKFADEDRQLIFVPMSGGLLVEFRSRLATDIADGVKLDGDPQHAGFHFRAHADVEAAAKQSYFLRPDGKGKAGEERNWDKTKKGPVNLPWNAMCFLLGEKRYTVCYLDHPDNPKEARQSERAYGRIGTYFEYTLTPAKPLVVRYRLWIQDGEMTVDQCKALSQAFTNQPAVVVK